MAKTFDVIVHERRPTGPLKERVAHRDLPARDAARAAVKIARAGDGAYVVPAGSTRADRWVMTCSRATTARRAGARVYRSFAGCDTTPEFKAALRTPKRKRRRK